MDNEKLKQIEKKRELFNKIYDITAKQREVLKLKDIDTDTIKKLIDKRQEYIDEINKIDEAYNLKGVLSEDIKSIIYKIQELEKENIKMLNGHFEALKKEMFNFNKSRNVTKSYNMYNKNTYNVGAIFFDRSR
ncbi:flagellar protein FliT [Defluviitalea phaphyphila]|uniref:flagellar protein FliT n=1 Tax=Defluviitalea phaphyphila TaxID=1473580 RepID=UPI0007313447|nr:flagellar protein FliT [Defluviitalea phaphyphila]